MCRIGIDFAWQPIVERCSSQSFPLPYFDTISSLKTDLFLMLGDNVYGDCEPITLTETPWNPSVPSVITGDRPEEYDSCKPLMEAYDQLAAHPSFKGFDVPILTTLDDHDR